MPNHFVPLTAAACLFPYRPHVNTLRRWASRGCHGVRLRTTKLGKIRMTTREWATEFVAAAIEATPDCYAHDAPATSTSHQRAEAQLDAMGV